MNYSFARCILLLLFLSVVSAEEDLKVQPASCASDTNPDGESCQQSPDPESNIVDIDITIDPMEAIKKYGVAQEADGSEKEQTIKRIIDSLEYMRSLKDMAHCRNSHKLCAFWSSLGECENNSFMTTQCGPSCHSCTKGAANDKSLHELSESELLMAVKAYGEPQELGEDDKLTLLDVIIDSIDYMRNLGDTLSQEIKDSCVNKHELCAYWVAGGECEANVVYMKANCGPSCRSCAMIDFD